MGVDKIDSWSDLAKCAYQKIEPIVGDHIAKTVITKGCEEVKTNPYSLSEEHIEVFAAYISKVVRIYDQINARKIQQDVKNCVPKKPI